MKQTNARQLRPVISSPICCRVACSHGYNWTDFMWDADFMHPIDPGMAAIADMAVHLLQNTALGLLMHPLGRQDKELLQERLPPPMHAGKRAVQKGCGTFDVHSTSRQVALSLLLLLLLHCCRHMGSQGAAAHLPSRHNTALC
jgi:hypothetical protein